MVAVDVKTKGITGRHVLVTLIAFFALIVGLDSLFISFALRTHPGEEVPNSYVLGLQYNEELERKAQQRTLGWSAEAGLVDEGQEMFVVRVNDKSGQPLSGLEVSTQLRIVGRADDGATIKLVERTAGEYVAPATFARKGRVVAEITARRMPGDADVFEAQKILVLS